METDKIIKGKLSPFFCRSGSKTTMIDDLKKNMPSSYSTYIEPFFGSGALFFSLNKADKEVINDLDKNLYEGMVLLKGAVVDPSKYKIPITEEEWNKYGARFKDKELLEKSRKYITNKIQNFVDKKPTTPQDKLLHKMYMSCNTFGKNFKGKIFNPSIGRVKINNLYRYKQRLQNTIIENKDYKEIIKKYDEPNAFIFLDPPYEKSTGIYKDAIIDYNEMNEILKKIKGKFLLTINDSPEIRKIFNEFRIVPIKVKSKGSNWGKALGASDRNELMIMNYNITGGSINKKKEKENSTILDVPQYLLIHRGLAPLL